MKPWLKGTPWTILGAIILGAIGSGVWNLLFEPGLNRGKRILLSIVTLGSSTARDQAYQSAALDPTPIPTLILLLLVVVILICASSFMIGFTGGAIFAMRRRPATADQEASVEAEDKSVAKRRHGFRRVTFMGGLLTALAFGFALTALASFMVANQAVLIWRTFNANIEVLSPHLSPLEEKAMRGRFRKIRSKSDYEKIRVELENIAAKSGEKLWDPELW